MPQPEWVSGTRATMTILATGLGASITAADPVILSANISDVRAGLQLSAGSTSFIAGLATLTLAAAVLGAGALGDKYGMKRMYTAGLLGAVAVPMPVLGSLLAVHIGWRACFLVAPAVALVALVLVLRYVPDTPRSARRLDVTGLLLVATALVATVYGLSRLQSGIHAGAIVPIMIGAVALAAFIAFELRVRDPALDLRIFRNRAFDAAVCSGVAFNFISGGSTILLAFYLVTVRGESPAVLGFLMAPAALLSAVAAAGAGRAAARSGPRPVLVAGLVSVLAGLLVLTTLGEQSGLAVVFAAVGLNAIGAAVAETMEATIMMADAPVALSGAVAAVKSAVGQAAYSMGPAVFALVGTTLFVRESHGITLEDAREALRPAHGGAGSAAGTNVLDPQRAREVVDGAHAGMIEAIHTLGWVLTAVPVAAIILVLVLVPRRSR